MHRRILLNVSARIRFMPQKAEAFFQIRILPVSRGDSILSSPSLYTTQCLIVSI
ncbi:hypothetical protein OH76DRAFT_1028818 [Lentinus brumalis]|uniref:Uncharacterized protein n=1 Tax=Lentinus brumalis TaxID=2498619 RepID=A0A371CXQ7_9APHY|nr:hypothetical protein OH76DRAFT_1028818 [Polyporus brumalis]